MSYHGNKNYKKKRGNNAYGYDDYQAYPEASNKTTSKEKVHNNEKKQQDEFFVFPGESFPYKKELIQQGQFYLNSSSNQMISKNFFKVVTSNTADSEDSVTNVVKLEGNYYKPETNDVIIGVIQSKTGELYRLDINAYTNAILGATEFEGATKKTKPNYKIGDVIFGKILKTNKFDVPLLTCISGDGKSWSSGQAYFGGCNSGLLVKYPLKYSVIFLQFSKGICQRIKDAIDFEFSIGCNGYLWINSKSIKLILKIKDTLLKWADLVYRICNRDGFESPKLGRDFIPQEIELLVNNTFKEFVSGGNKDKIKAASSMQIDEEVNTKKKKY